MTLFILDGEAGKVRELTESMRKIKKIGYVKLIVS